MTGLGEACENCLGYSRYLSFDQSCNDGCSIVDDVVLERGLFNLCVK